MDEKLHSAMMLHICGQAADCQGKLASMRSGELAELYRLQAYLRANSSMLWYLRCDGAADIAAAMSRTADELLARAAAEDDPATLSALACALCAWPLVPEAEIAVERFLAIASPESGSWQAQQAFVIASAKTGIRIGEANDIIGRWLSSVNSERQWPGISDAEALGRVETLSLASCDPAFSIDFKKTMQVVWAYAFERSYGDPSDRCQAVIARTCDPSEAALDTAQEDMAWLAAVLFPGYAATTAGSIPETADPAHGSQALKYMAMRAMASIMSLMYSGDGSALRRMPQQLADEYRDLMAAIPYESLPGRAQQAESAPAYQGRREHSDTRPESPAAKPIKPKAPAPDRLAALLSSLAASDPDALCVDSLRLAAHRP